MLPNIQLVPGVSLRDALVQAAKLAVIQHRTGTYNGAESVADEVIHQTESVIDLSKSTHRK